MVRGLLALLALVLVMHPASARRRSYVSFEDLTARKVHRFEDKARRDLFPSFTHAHMQYPPKKIALLVFKREHIAELWAKNTDKNGWSYIKEFNILAASGYAGPKMRAGDRQVPEGIYCIVALNPASNYDVSMMINYPNAFDRYHAKLDHRRNLGSNIFIHGSDVSWGCIALGNRVIEDLFVLAYKVGMDNISVIIAPNDLRYDVPVVSHVHPSWIDELDEKIATALKPFKSAKKHQPVEQEMV